MFRPPLALDVHQKQSEAPIYAPAQDVGVSCELLGDYSLFWVKVCTRYNVYEIGPIYSAVSQAVFALPIFWPTEYQCAANGIIAMAQHVLL